MNVLAIDPGLATCGFAVLDLRSGSDTLLRAWAFTTEKADRKRAVRAAEDNARRVGELVREAMLAIDTFSPHAMCMEASSWPRNAGAAAKVALAFGALWGLAATLKLPVVQASPQDVKLAICGSKKASKEEVIAAVERRFPNVMWPAKEGLWEHAADAVGVAVACMDSPVVQMVRRFNVKEAG